MTTAIIKLTLRLPTGRQRQTQWEFDAGRRSRISDAAEEGCRRLGVDVNDFNFDFAEEFDAEDEPKLNLLPDEMVQPGSVYIIADQQLNHRQSQVSALSPSITASSLALQPPHLLVSPPYPSPSTAFSTNSQSNRQCGLSADLATASPYFSTPTTSADGSSTIARQQQPSTPSPARRIVNDILNFSFNDAPFQPSSSSSVPPVYRPSRKILISNFFVKNEHLVNETFATYAPAEPMIFLDSNIYEFFNERPLVKCAVFILRAKADPELNQSTKKKKRFY